MATAAEQTVRDVVLENPGAARVFERIGIDYCCGGKASFAEACAKAGVSEEHIRRLIAASAATGKDVAWNQGTMAALIRHIVTTHHAYVRSESPRITGLLAKIAGRHGQAHPELVEMERVFGALAQELTLHMMKEEHVLFPYVEGMETEGGVPASCFGTVERPIAAMIAEHEDAGALLERLREISKGYVPADDMCNSCRVTYRALEEFEQNLHQHIHLENNILFPQALEMERRGRVN